MTTYNADELVDITIHGAIVDHHGDHTLTITIPGWSEPIDIPLVDQDGGPMTAVKIMRGDVISSTPTAVVWAVPSAAPSPDRPAGTHRAAESVEAAHANGNHAWCDHGTIPGYQFDQLIELDTLGQDYLTDPAARIAQIAAIAPEYVVKVTTPRRWCDSGGDVWEETPGGSLTYVENNTYGVSKYLDGMVTDRAIVEQHYGPLTEVATGGEVL